MISGKDKSSCLAVNRETKRHQKLDLHAYLQQCPETHLDMIEERVEQTLSGYSAHIQVVYIQKQSKDSRLRSNYRLCEAQKNYKSNSLPVQQL